MTGECNHRSRCFLLVTSQAPICLLMQFRNTDQLSSAKLRKLRKLRRITRFRCNRIETHMAVKEHGVARSANRTSLVGPGQTLSRESLTMEEIECQFVGA